MSTIKKGFTLIELLVVIAIIGILATVVLASLGTARTRANDAKVQGNMSSMRIEMELNANGGAYTCAPAVLAKYSVTTNAIACIVNSSAGGTAWAATHPLAVGTFCVDSTGVAKVGTTNLATFACN